MAEHSGYCAETHFTLNSGSGPGHVWRLLSPLFDIYLAGSHVLIENRRKNCSMLSAQGLSMAWLRALLLFYMTTPCHTIESVLNQHNETYIPFRG